MKAIIFYYSNSGKTKNVATKIQENLDNFISGLDIIVVVMVLCSLALALVVLYNLINVNVFITFVIYIVVHLIFNHSGLIINDIC